LSFRPGFRVASALPFNVAVMTTQDDERIQTKTCARCGGRAFYWNAAIVPGNPAAPRGRRSALPHVQPAWQCLSCGYLEPEERRARLAHRQGE
jgi:hypothetical protein